MSVLRLLLMIITCVAAGIVGNKLGANFFQMVLVGFLIGIIFSPSKPETVEETKKDGE